MLGEQDDLLRLPRLNEVLVALVGALVGAVIGGLFTIIVTDRQIKASREDLRDQISAARADVRLQVSAAEDQQGRADQRDAAGRIVQRRAEAYAAFLADVNRHLEVLGDSGQATRNADAEVFAKLRSVQLLGSGSANRAAQRLAGRTRKLTNDALGGRRLTKPATQRFFRQQRESDDFVSLVQPELRR